MAEVKEKKSAASKKTEGKKLRVTLMKSTIGCLEKQKRTVEALGLKKIRSCAVHEDNACIRGMIFVVKHLVKVEEI